MTTTCLHSFPDPHPAPLTRIGDCRHCGTSYQEAKAAMTAADEIEAAAEKMRTFAGPAAEPIAKLLREIAALHTPNVCRKHEGCGPHGCDWCGDEDWPCNDIRNALAVARAILGTQEQP
jgi:hypothetical protein